MSLSWPAITSGKATHVVRNDGSREDLERQVEALWRELAERARATDG